MLGLEGKVAIVTGAASGIGAALAAALKQAGAIVEIFDVASEPRVDITDPAIVAAAIAGVIQRHRRIDILYSNAGYLAAGESAYFDLDEFDRIIAVNLRGAFIVARGCIPHLCATQGAIVFTASTAAVVGSAGEAAYAASKAGLLGLMRSLAAELAPRGVRVNAVAPGWVDTPFNDPIWKNASDPAKSHADIARQIALGRQATPEEVVMPMMMLGSPGAAYVTGQVLAIDGGISTLR